MQLKQQLAQFQFSEFKKLMHQCLHTFLFKAIEPQHFGMAQFPGRNSGTCLQMSHNKCGTNKIRKENTPFYHSIIIHVPCVSKTF